MIDLAQSTERPPLPRVSICLPTFNSIEHLEQRIDSILKQTIDDWELIVVDSHSTDGTTERLHALALSDARVTVHTAPRGLYAAWNEALLKARGEYIYIATADDTMEPNCLELASSALARQPEALLCHFCINCINSAGVIIPGKWNSAPGIKSYGSAIKTEHLISSEEMVRRLLRNGTVITSVTEMLFRRRLLALAGLFPTDQGSAGDYAWQFAAVRAAPVLHIPNYLATWRLHDKQASKATLMQSANVNFEICQSLQPSLKKTGLWSSMLPRIQRAVLRRIHLKSTGESYAYHSRFLDIVVLSIDSLFLRKRHSL